MKKSVQVFLCFFLSCFVTLAQDTISNIALKQQKADDFFLVGEYNFAIILYKDLIKQGETSANNYYKCGLALEELYNPIVALPYFENALKNGFEKSQIWEQLSHFKSVQAATHIFLT